MQIEITNRCSLSCPQCYKPDVPLRKDMDVSLFLKILQEANQLNVSTLMLNGGEPLEHNKISLILHLLENYNFQVHCISSGYGLTDDIIDMLKSLEMDIKLSISLNGSTEEIHGLSRDGYKYGIAAIKKLVKNNIQTGINWVCRRDNVRDFPLLVEYAKENHVSWINIAANKLTGSGMLDSPLETDDYVFLLDYLKNQTVVDKKFIRVQYCFSLLNDLRDFGINQHLSRCPAGSLSCCVDVNGNYLPCTHLYFPEKFGSIAEYWNQSEVLNELRIINISQKNCSGCAKSSPCHFCKAMFINTAEHFSEKPKDCPVMVLYN